jgi:hypothetical protein
MRVVVTSDTHLPRFGRALPRPLVDALRRADLVLHCGDLTQPFVIDLLEEHAPTVAIAGNNDAPELHERLGTARVVEVAGARLGMTHGYLGPGRTTRERALRTFAAADPPLDAICFGHSHIPLVERRGGLWLLNPGSPTDRRRQRAFSDLELDIEGGEIRPDLVEYPSR